LLPSALPLTADFNPNAHAPGGGRISSPNCFRHFPPASPGRGVSGDDCRHSADGGFLHRRREREIVPADLQDEFPGDRGHRVSQTLPPRFFVREKSVFHPC
jgi:hypothetical protein